MQLKEKSKLETSIKTLNQLINTIKTSRLEYSKYRLKETSMQKLFDEKLIEIGQCPFCGTTFDKKGHVC